AIAIVGVVALALWSGTHDETPRNNAPPKARETVIAHPYRMLERSLSASIGYNRSLQVFRIENRDTFPWTSCLLSLNSHRISRLRVSVTTYSSKELPHIRGELPGLLQREKVAAALEFRPMHHVVVALGKAADGDVLRLRYQDARGHAAAGLGRRGGRVVQRLV